MKFLIHGITIFLCLTILSLLIYISSNKNSIYRESFQNSKVKSIKENIRIKKPYDSFYAPVYQTLITDQIKDRTKFEVDDLIKQTKIKEYSNASLLDIGTGGGEHILLMNKKNFPNLHLTGIDKSDSMLNLSRKKLKNKPVRFIQRDVLDDDLFLPGSFSHITCYYFTIYLLNTDKLIKNIYSWLRPGGWFAVHLVDLYKFDPILDASSPFIGTTLQRYTKNRITESKIHFKKFLYHSNFLISNKKGTKKCYFDEIFDFKNKPSIRKQRHTLNVFSVEQFIKKMGKNKFTLKNTTDMSHLNYPFQYILYFQK